MVCKYKIYLYFCTPLRLFQMNDTFAKRLINARKIRCISQRELCSRLNNKVSSTAIEKYEKALMMPSSDVLIEISKALNFTLDYFFRPFVIPIDDTKFEFRKKSSLGAKKIESMKCQVVSEIERYLEIENISENNVKFTLDYSNTIIENESDAMIAANRLRKDLNIGSDAIVSAIELLENNGIKIIEIEHDEKFSGTCNKAGDVPVIVINKNMSPERKRITIFHELGHLLLHFADGVNEEQLCTIFANEVLIPSDKFKKLIGESRHGISLVELQAIQKEYGISVDAQMAKAAQLNIITSNRYSSFHKKKNAVSEFKSAVEQSIYKEESSNRYKRLVYRAMASDLISTSKAAALLNVSVNQVRNNINLV